MHCEEARERLVDLLTGDAADAGAVREHVRECEACRREAAALGDLWSGLEAIPAIPPDSTAMRARFASMLEGHEQGREAAEALRLSSGQSARWEGMNGWLMRLWPRGPLVQLAGAAALVVLGLVVGRATAAPAAGDVASLRSELREMRQMVSLSLMQQQSASDRLKGVNWSGRLEAPGAEVVSALLDTLLHDPNVNVRLAAIDALARFADDRRVRQGAIDALESASSPLVQIALIDFVVGAQDRTSVEALKRLAADPALDEAVRARAALGLERLGVKS
jgi:HEAT repeat protein